jgi:hypothetical protein
MNESTTSKLLTKRTEDFNGLLTGEDRETGNNTRIAETGKCALALRLIASTGVWKEEMSENKARQATGNRARATLSS